jgi:hypothetical protein
MLNRPDLTIKPGSAPHRDTIIYSATCPRLSGRVAAVKVYDKAKVAPTKLRAIKREIAMMMFFQRKN